ncbi:MAG: hypothetical protein ISS93_02185 [Candidatus Aenigmarchaeota archaeon]|nr:hypothetical protein [Candidatus Aenigmarchaeota archaeon]
MKPEKRLEDLGQELEESFDVPKPRIPFSARLLPLALASSLILPACRSPKTISVITHPEGADVGLFQDKDPECIGRVQGIPSGEWVYLEKTPVNDFEYISGQSPVGGALVFTLYLWTIVPPILFLIDQNTNPTYTVGVRKDGYYPQYKNFRLKDVPPHSVFEFRLSPIMKYSFSINSKPEGASVEIYEQLKVFDPSVNDWVPTDKADFMYKGNTPHDFDDYVETDGNIDRIAVIKLKKPGYRSKTINLPLGQQPSYFFELERIRD